MSAAHTIDPRRESLVMKPKNGCWFVKKGEEYYYTSKRDPRRGSKSVQNNKQERYTNMGFCEINEDDTVVDIGSFLGEFALPVANKAQKVIAIEPDPQTYKCLKLQTEGIENISVINALPSNASREVTFKSADDPSESSLIDVDEGNYTEISMESQPIEDILANVGVSKVDFLKMDAEGAEPEVLEGIGGLSVDKFAIDVGCERKNQKTETKVGELLTQKGYKIKVQKDKFDDPVLFAKK